MTTQDIIKDPVTGQSFFRNSVNETYRPYTAPAPETSSDPLGGFVTNKEKKQGKKKKYRYTSPDSIGANLFKNRPMTFTQRDADRIRTQTQAQFQGAIDAIESRFRQNVTQLGTEGENRLGRQRAISARGGLLGSARGESQRSGVEQYNRGLVQEEENRRNLEVAGLYERIDNRAFEAIEARKAEIAGNAEAYINFLKGSRESAREDLKTIAANGLNVEDLDPEDISELMEQGGFESEFMLEQFLNANRPKEAQVDWQYKTVGNQIVAYGVDPKTGQLKQMNEQLPFDIPKDYDVQTLPNGQIMFVPKEFDPTKRPQDQVILYGAAGQFTKDGIASDAKGTVENQLATAKNALKQAKELADASGRGRSWYERTKQGFFGATEYTNLEAYANTLRTSVLSLATDPQVKKFFGPQMSNADVQLMTSAGTSLNPELMGPEAFTDELERLEELFDRLSEAADMTTGSDSGDDTKNVDYSQYGPGDTVPLEDGSYAIVADDGNTLLDPVTMKPIQQ